MTAIYLDNPVYTLGELSFSLQDSAAAGRVVSDSDALAEAGFDRHHICGPATTVVDLAERCLAQLERPASESDALVFATALTPNGSLGDPAVCAATRDVRHSMNFAASHLQQRLAMTDAPVIGLNQQACTATLGAIRIARGLLAAEPDLADIVCVSADRFPENALYEQGYNLISDGAAGFRISRRAGRYRILACHQITKGAFAQASDDETVGAYFTYSTRLIRETAAKAALDVADIDWIVPQNMNRTALVLLARLLAVDESKLVSDMLPQVGHVIGADNIINLRHLQDSGRMTTGDTILLVMAGFGLNWQAVLLEVAP